MPQKVIKFTGIDRKVNEFQSTGACEELINLRPSKTGLRIVRKKHATAETVSGFKAIYEHKFGANENLLVITDSSVKWIAESGSVRQSIVDGVTAERITCAGNVIVITYADGGQGVFKFLNGSYTEFSASIPLIDISVELGAFDASALQQGDTAMLTLEQSRAILTSAYSNFYNSHPYGLAGPIVVGCTFELEDGSEIWSSGFSIIDPTKDANFTAPTYKSDLIQAIVYGARDATLNFKVDNYSNVTGVKNIKFYSSLPVAPYEMDDLGNTFYAKPMTKIDMNLAGQNMYLQKVISFRKNGSFKLSTEYKLAANDLMPVTSGPIYRTGDVVSYNNRFHFFNSVVKHPLQYMSHGVHSNRALPEESTYVDIRQARMFVVIDNGEEEILVQDNGTFDVQFGTTMDFVYPMGGIKKGYLQTSDDNFSTSRWFYIEFEDSSAYNYSCALDYLISSPCDEPTYTRREESHGQSILWKTEAAAINVSAQYNPFVFPVEYSYGFEGKINDVATSYLPISSTQVGQYPLTVFTTIGIFALEQGNGAVLYSNITPIQPLVMDGKATTTPFGTFFISSKNLYLLSGREQVNVSHVLNGERELYIRELNSYRQLCCGNNNGLYNFEPLLSGEDFEDFIDDVSLTYDQLQNELYISSNDDSINYSYVLNLDTNAFHKVSKRYRRAQNGSRYAIELTGDTSRLVDLYIEEKGEQPIFIQSRPMSLDIMYSHIQRLLLLADTKLEDSQYLCFSVFASDNLYDWKCIISAQKHDTVLRQIRTNRAAKSYKDYIIVINGIVHSDTDISDIIADYTVVNRRLG